TGGANHEYDDGYVRVDSTHNGLGLTWNWGFDRPSQVMGDNLEMHSSRTLADGRSRADDEVQHGFEFTYARELGIYGKARWGFEGAFNYTRVDMKEGGSVPVTVVRTTDTYDVSGIDPFNPPGSQTPYRGTFLGPGTLIPDAPIGRREEVTPGGAMASGTRELNANLFGMRVGPYLDLPLNEKWMLTLNGGFALVAVNSDFKFSDSVLGRSARGSDSQTDLLPGGYVGANISYQVAPSTRIFAGAEYQAVGDFTQDAGGRRARLDLGNSVFVRAGVSFSF
ncbi:MAG TPA: hypothetical protein VJ063_20070, partial [Verrucomicrobiae bacterium]|nr:hypothetical protein [Verrucomicrobiae bacterium]